MCSKSIRNRTIDLDLVTGRPYLDRCVSLSDCVDKVELSRVLNGVILGDTFTVLPKISAQPFAHLAIIDPPYNLTKSFGTKAFKKLSVEDYVKYTDTWVRLLLPTLLPNASVYVCCDWHCSSAIESVLQKYFTIQNRITWQRNKGRGCIANWKNDMEDIWFATVSPKDYTFNINAVKHKRKVVAPYKEDGKPKDWVETGADNYRLTCPSNIWTDLVVPFWSMKENTAHPTQKPEKLLAKLILASSNPGDIVIDPFSGSGSTLVVAKKLGRQFVGIEQEAQYCVWAEKRLEMADTDKTIQGYQGVFEI